MIIDTKGSNIHLRWREDGERKEETIKDYKPYFFISGASHWHKSKMFVKKYGKERGIPVDIEWGDWQSLQGKNLKKITYHNPKDRWTLMNEFHKQGIATYQADVDIKRLYAVDRMTEIKEYEHRKWYFDIESQVGGVHDGKTTVLSIYDSFTKKNTVMTWFPKEARVDYKNVRFSSLDYVQVYQSETEMFYAFIEMMEEQDPDMIIGWYILGYDIPQIIKRMCKLGIDPNRMSPCNEIKDVRRKFSNGETTGWQLGKGTGDEKYFNSAQPIRGRLTFCLMDRFERLWTDSQNGTLPSLKLDDCANLVLGERKVESSKFEDLEFYERAWLEDTKTYLEYAKVDVDLCVNIDNKLNVSENSLALQRLIVCPFENTYHNSQMGGVYFMRKSNWIPPTGVKTEKERYDGAFVMDPTLEGTYGQHENVAVFDFKSLYPSMMAAVNISWETKRGHGYPVWVNTPKNLEDFEEKPTYYYEKDTLGLLPQAVIDMMALRDEYKTLRKEAKTDEEYIKWDSAQMATKRAVNAFYGILAKEGFGWADMEMVQSITASARHAMRETAFKAQELGYEVIYGHTDSVFVKVRDVDDAKQLRVLLNDYISREIFREPVELEFEKFASKFFLSKKKNRYCGYLSWKDGEYLPEDKFFVMGFEMKKSNETKVAKKFQENLLKMVASFKEEREVIDYCNQEYAKVVKGEVSLREISKRSRLRRNIEDYDMIAGGSAGIIYHNQQGLGKIKKGDAYYYFKINNADLEEKCYILNGVSKSCEYISFLKFKDIKDMFTPDWEFIANGEIIKKALLVFESMEWPIKLIKKDINQTTLEEWW